MPYFNGVLHIACTCSNCAAIWTPHSSSAEALRQAWQIHHVHRVHMRLVSAAAASQDSFHRCATLSSVHRHTWNTSSVFRVSCQTSQDAWDLRQGEEGNVDIMSVIDIVCDCEVVFTANPCRVANHFDPLPLSISLSLSVSSAGITSLILLSFTL